LGTTERKEREKAELKELILKSAQKILLDQGHESLSIRKIATDIEYSPATIYLYYSDKDEILHDLMELGFLQMRKYMVNAFEEQNPIDRIHKIGKGYIEFGIENPDWYELMFNSTKPIQHMIKCHEEWDQGMTMFQFLVVSCDEAIKKLKMKNVEPQILALQLWSSVHGLVSLAQSQRLNIVELNNSDALIHRTLDSMLVTIFK
jgi:AcrR family transcriptional regulator